MMSHTGSLKSRKKGYRILDFSIIVDTRETLPYSFLDFYDDSPRRDRLLVIQIKRKALVTGDYSIVGLENHICIERKSIEDLYGTLGSRRDQFEYEFSRMKQMQFAALVIEASWSQLLCSPPPHSQLSPKTVYRTLIAWAQRYRVHVMPMGSRRNAEQTTLRMLQRYWNDLQEAKKGCDSDEAKPF